MPHLQQETIQSEAETLYQEGLTALYQSNFLYAQSLLQSSLQLSQQNARQTEIARTLRTLAIVMANQKEYEAARRLFEQSMTIRRSQGNGQEVGTLLMDLGILEQQQGNLSEACAYFEESLEFQETANNRKYVAYLHLFLGRLALDMKQPLNAQDHLQCSLDECESLHDQECGADVLRELALLAFSQQETEGASRLIAAADLLAPLSEGNYHFAAIENLKTTLRTEQSASSQ